MFYCLGGTLTKSKILAGRTPNAYQEGHSTQSVGWSFKKAQHICRFASELQFRPKKVPLILILAVPYITKNPKKCRFCPFRHRFKPNCWGIAKIKVRCAFVGQSSSPDAERKTYMGRGRGTYVHIVLIPQKNNHTLTKRRGEHYHNNCFTTYVIYLCAHMSLLLVNNPNQNLIGFWPCCAADDNMFGVFFDCLLPSKGYPLWRVDLETSQHQSARGGRRKQKTL